MSNLRQFTMYGRRAEFNKTAFCHYVKQKSRREKIAISKLEELIGESVGVSANAVHHWIYKKGGPGDAEMIAPLAKILDIADPAQLIIFVDNGGTEMERLTDRQKTAAKRIYDLCIWFLYEFERTDGFNDYWLKFKESGSKDPEMDIYSTVEDMIGKINMALDQEYFDLRGCDLYNELCEYVSDDLYETFNGKLGYGYRFEAQPNGNPTTTEDYDRAMIRLNTIIDKYL